MVTRVHASDMLMCIGSALSALYQSAMHVGLSPFMLSREHSWTLLLKPLIHDVELAELAVAVDVSTVINTEA